LGEEGCQAGKKVRKADIFGYKYLDLTFDWGGPSGRRRVTESGVHDRGGVETGKGLRLTKLISDRGGALGSEVIKKGLARKKD